MRNLKKVIALVAVFAMMVSTVAFGQSFTDVAEDADYYEAIEMLSKLQILTGDDQDGDGKMDFRPNDTITRAEVAAIISRIQGVNSVSQTATEFVDVPATHWASGYVAAAAGQGIVNGYGDGNFGPDDQVLYEQAVKMLVETLGYTPYVETVGGYPVGHLTAASRYGVLDGVIGGTTGAEATRGQVAQMVFNAVDTPLMDRWTYGGESEFLIYDGKTLLGSPYRSLLTDRLNVKKFEGVVTGNRLNASLVQAEGDIDTDDEEVINVAWEVNDDYSNYKVEEIVNGTLYAGESGIGDLIGKYVVGYAQEGNRTGEYTVLSAAAATKNKTVTFTLDQYADYANGYIEYFKNESDRTATALKVDFTNGTGESNHGVLYNGVAYNDSIFGLEIAKDSKWGGQVTLIDNDSNSGYDVALIEVAAPAVVDAVSAAGKVSFKNPVKGMLAERPQLLFDEEDNTQIIKLTKDGVEASVEDITEWTVLSIYANNSNEYYDVRILDSSVVEGSVGSKATSVTSATGSEYKIAGTAYDVAMNAYECDDLKPGDAGLFYIDAYGKLVAYDKDGNRQGSDNYGFVIIAQSAPDIWGDENLVVQVLDKDGSVYNKYLAERVEFENIPSGIVAGNADGTYKLEAIDLDALADALTNQLITYDATSDGDIDLITFYQTDEEESSLTLVAKSTAAQGCEFDADEQEMKVGTKTVGVDENTVVFFIRTTDVDAQGQPLAFVTGLGDTTVSASKITSKVGTVATIAHELKGKPVAAYDEDNNGVVSALVIFNTSGGISNSSNIAVIDSVGTATDDNGDDVLAVEYFMNGEAQYALTDADLDNDRDLAAADQGDIWRFAVTADGVITEAIEYAQYDRTESSKTAGATMSLKTVLEAEEAFIWGPVIKASGNRIRVVDQAAGTVPVIANDAVADLTTINAEGANVYVYDPVKRNNKIYVGDASYVSFDEELIEKDITAVDDNGDRVTQAVYDRDDQTNTGVWVAAGTTALGMLDYAAGIEYEGDILDVVIYKAYDFGKYVIK